ncbi:MAG: transcriptional regulator [Terriglobia bacterium]
MADPSTIYAFGEFRLDPATAGLRRDDQEVNLSPRAFQVLAYLVEHRNRVVGKQELVEAVWKDTFVTDDALVQAITAIRRALGDDADHPRYIRTRPRIGYQFIAPVELGSGAIPDSSAAPVSIWVAPIGRRWARTLMLALQVGYLALYSFTLLQLDTASRVLASTLLRVAGLESLAWPLLVVLALTGVAVRLYLITAVALDHPETGRQYRRLFPALFVVDELWALSPLLLAEATGLPIALALVPALVYIPFSQHTLIRSAYPARR